MKGQGKTSGKKKQLNKTEINDLPDKEFKRMVIKMLTEVRGKMHEQSENFNRDRKYKIIPNRITELKNSISELKNSEEGFNIRLDKAEEKISKLKDIAVEFIQSEEQK